MIIPILLLLLFVMITQLFIIARYQTFAVHIASALVVLSCTEFSKRFLYLEGSVDPLFYYSILFSFDVFMGVIFITRLKSFGLLTIIFLIVLSLFGAYSIFQGKALGFILATRSCYYLIALVCFKDSYYVETKQSQFIHILLLGVLTTFSILYGCVQYFYDYLPWEYTWGLFAPAQMSLNAMGNFGHANRAFACFSGNQVHALILTYIFIWLYFNFPKTFFYPSRYVILAFYLLGIFIAGSKGLMVGTLLSFCLYYCRKIINFKAIFIAIVIVPFSAYWLISNSLLYFLQTFLYAKTPSFIAGMLDPMTFSPRLMIFSQFFKSLEKNYTLFLGHGSSALDLTSNFNTDNMYLSILYEFGVLGVVVFIYLLYLFLKKNDAIFKTLGSTSAYFRKNASICFVFFSANLFNFLTSQSIVSNGGMLLFLLIIGYQRGLLCTAKKLYFQTTFKNYQTSLAR